MKVKILVLSLLCVGFFALASKAAFRVWDYLPASQELPAALAKAERMGLPMHAMDLDPNPPVDESDNAAPTIRAFTAEARASGRFDLDVPLKKGDLAAVEAGLARYDRLLTLAHDAASKPGVDFKRDWDLGPALLLPELADMKVAVKALCARAQVRASKNDMDGAISDLRDALVLSDHAGSDPILIGLLVKIACRAIAYKSVQHVAAQWANEPAHLELLERLLREPRSPLDFRKSLHGEVFMGVAFLRNYNVMGGEKMLTSNGGDLPKIDPRRLRRDGVPGAVKPRAYLARHLQGWTSVWDKINGDPRAAGKVLDEMGRRTEAQRAKSYALAAILNPVFSQAGTTIVKSRADEATTLALVRALKRRGETGGWPSKLTEIDPFDGKPLRIRAQKDGSVRVYSVGEDGHDDLGKDRSEVKNPSMVAGGWDVVASYPPVK
jgi:hypothetical protein